MNEYFIQFHKKVKTFGNTVKQGGDGNEYKIFNQRDFYDALFGEQKTSKAKEGGISENMVAHWLGKEPRWHIPDWIVKPVIADPEEYKEKYKKVFSDFCMDMLFQSEEMENKLKKELQNLLESWEPKLSIYLPKNESGLEDILATTLVTALIYDYAVRKTLLDDTLKIKLEAEVQRCAENNFAFKTPHILSALLENERSLLCFALNKVCPEKEYNNVQGGGNIFRYLIYNYIKAGHHNNPYTPVNLDTERLLVIAKILAFRKNEPVVNKFYICCALRLFSSNSISQMKAFAGKKWDSYETWENFLRECQRELTASTDLYIFNEN